jgi:DNA replication licensing factor MCM5
MISADRYLANRVVPGTRCTITGVYSIYQQKGNKRSQNAAVAIRNPYIRAVGIHTDIDHTTKGNAVFTAEEEQEFLEMSRRSLRPLYSTLHLWKRGYQESHRLLTHGRLQEDSA